MAYSRNTTQTYWYKNCSSCGKEFELKSKDDPFYLCPACTAKNARERAVREATFLAGATVTAYELKDDGHFTTSEELESVTLRTTDGRVIKLTAECWSEGGYIGWEEQK